MRSNARDHANPDARPATTSQAIPGSTTLFTADQMAAIKFEKSFVNLGGFWLTWLSYQDPLHSERG
jgi:hypothetical protein